MIVKVGESLGETFGNFVCRLAATLAVLTPVILAFRASVLVVHPILPDRGHAAMLAMVKDGSWFRLAHRYSPSMAFYRARAGADTLKQDELRAAAGQCSERWRRLGRWDGGCGGSLGVGLRAFQEFHAYFTGLCCKQWRERPDTIYLDPLQSAIIKQPGSREGGTVASAVWGPLPTMAAVSRPLTKAGGACPIWTPERGSSSPIAFATWGRKIGP